MGAAEETQRPRRPGHSGEASAVQNLTRPSTDHPKPVFLDRRTPAPLPFQFLALSTQPLRPLLSSPSPSPPS